MTETNAKRLDRIQYKTTFIFSADTGECDGVDLPVEDFNYLIEQAERTQMLTEAAKGSKIILNMETNDRHRLEKENKRLREALDSPT